MNLSIIIPVYNSIQYIKDTIDSILESKNNTFEILLINDGSTDGSGKVCYEYVNRDRRVRLIDRQNMGASSARNLGIDIANGKFIWFVDGDDIVVTKNVDEIINFVEREEPDIVYGNYYRIKDNKISSVTKFQYNNTEMIKLRNYELASYLWGDIGISWSIWFVIYKTSFLKKNRITFNQNMTYYVDADFNLKAVMSSNKSMSIDKSIYIYRTDNINSMLHNPNIKDFNSAHNFFVYWFSFFQHRLYESDKCELILFRLSKDYEKLLGLIDKLSNAEKSYASELYKQNEYIQNFRYRNTKERGDENA